MPVLNFQSSNQRSTSNIDILKHKLPKWFYSSTFLVQIQQEDIFSEHWTTPACNLWQLSSWFSSNYRQRPIGASYNLNCGTMTISMHHMNADTIVSSYNYIYITITWQEWRVRVVGVFDEVLQCFLFSFVVRLSCHRWSDSTKSF